MTVRHRVVLVVLWALSLVVVAQWEAQAQARLASPGVEVRFMRSQGAGGTVTGTLVANVGGQWLPVKLAATPDGDGNQPR